MLSSVLKDLGIDPKEQQVYLELLRRGPSRASTLAYQLKLPRTTVQNILVRLEQEKIVNKVIKKNVYIYSAIHPENLIRVAQIRQKQGAAHYDRIIDDLNIVMPEMMSMLKSSKNLPSVKFFQGRDAVHHVLFDTLTSKTELKDYANIDAMFQHAQDINDAYVAEREKSKVTKRSLLMDTPFARSVYEGGEYSTKSHKGYKWINSSLYPFAIEMNIYDGKVSYITYIEDDFFGVIIENQYIYQMHESMWNMMWDLLPDEKGKRSKRKVR